MRIERVRQSSRSSVKSSKMNDPAFCSNTRKPADGPLDDDDAGPVVLLADGGGGGCCCCVVGLLLVTTTFATGVCFVSLCCSLPLATLSFDLFSI